MLINQQELDTQFLVLEELRDFWQQNNFSLLPHQIEAAKRVINELQGRALLADEVGLGKTIEAALILKEYILRGKINNFLVLAPASLGYQWWSELNGKFEIDVFNNRKGRGWHYFDYQIASIDLAKRQPHADLIKERNFEMIVVDEAHKLKNDQTLNWKFIKQLNPKYMLFLTATPIQNNLKELYNLFSLLKPELVGSYNYFKSNFIEEVKEEAALDCEFGSALDQLMIRNTREETKLKFSARQVKLNPVQLSDLEKNLYQQISELVEQGKDESLTDLHLIILERELCSSPWALIGTLKELAKNLGAELQSQVKEMIDLASQIEINNKLIALKQILTHLDGQAVIFTEYLATQNYICYYLYQEGIMPIKFDGSLSDNQKEWAKQLFAKQGDVLVSTKAGRQGINLQFCNVVINYDLPWNPMKLEQRIGRVHRLGQEREVEIYNLLTRETVEERILELLVEKIDLFESVVGELDNIIES